MTTNTLVRCCEEAAEFGHRFPDESEFDVLDHVSGVVKLSAYLEPQWAISRCVMQAYEYAANTTLTTAQATEEGISTAKMWGLIPAGFVYNPNQLYID